MLEWRDQDIIGAVFDDTINDADNLALPLRQSALQVRREGGASRSFQQMKQGHTF